MLHQITGRQNTLDGEFSSFRRFIESCENLRVCSRRRAVWVAPLAKIHSFLRAPLTQRR
jgi:hypothetical protein